MNNNNGNNEAVDQGQAQQPVSHSVFDTPASAHAATAPSAEAQPPAGTTKEEESLFSDSLFTDDTNKPAKASDSPDAETIKKLEAAGYKVEKAEVVDQDKQLQEKLSFHEKNINDAKEFISKDDKYIVTEKLKNDKADTYRNTGRAHLIGSEEFDIEIEAQLDAEYDNPAMLQMFANNLRSAIQANVIDRNTQEKTQIISKEEAKLKTEVQERTKKLEASFDQIFKEGYLNMKFDRQVIIDARNNVISGKFAEEVKNNPEILAKVALVYYQEQDLVKKVGQPTYGEGVAATYHALNGGDKGTANTSPAQAASNMGASANGTFEVNKWLNIAETDEDKNKKVI